MFIICVHSYLPTNYPFPVSLPLLLTALSSSCIFIFPRTPLGVLDVVTKTPAVAKMLIDASQVINPSPKPPMEDAHVEVKPRR